MYKLNILIVNRALHLAPFFVTLIIANAHTCQENNILTQKQKLLKHFIQLGLGITCLAYIQANWLSAATSNRSRVIASA